MSYLVLARKWRPRTFDAVVGQEHVTRTLENAIELGRVAHALLFTGSRGIGKTSCARILAKALNCQEGPTPKPCGTCSFCRDIENGSSVDVFEIDGASNNSVEQIREIRESVKFLPTAKGKRKMYIIDEVHMLSTSAFNALLKTLEEPPEHVLFVFATTEPHKIPDTIVSRCQRYDFKRIPEKAMVGALAVIAEAEAIEVDEVALRHLAREAAGGMRDSLSLLDQVIAYCGMSITEERVREVLGIADRRMLFAIVDALHAGHGHTVVEIIDSLFQGGINLQKFAGELVRHLRDLMVVKICAEPTRLLDLSDGELNLMGTQAETMTPAQIHRAFNALLKCADEVTRSPFPKLVLEMGLLQVCAQGPTLPVSDALRALADLEAKLADGVRSQAPAPAPDQPSSRPMEGPQGHGAAEQDSALTQDPVGHSTGTGEGVPTETGNGAAEDAVQRTNPSTIPPWDESIEAPSGAEDEAARTMGGEGPTNGAAPVQNSPLEGPAQSKKEAESATETKQATAEKVSPKTTEESAKAFQRRPKSETGEYDDFSAAPPSPLPIDSLRPLNLKARRELIEPSRAPEGQSMVPEQQNVPPTRTESIDRGRERAGGGDDAQPAVETPPTSDDDEDVPAQRAEAAAERTGASEAPPPETGDAPPETEDAPAARLDFDDEGTEIEHFAELVGRMRRIDPFLTSEFEQNSHLLEFTNSSLNLAMDTGDAEMLSRGRPLLEEILQTAVSPDCALEVDLFESGHHALSGETLYDRKQRLQREELERRRNLARSSTPIKMMVDTLKATIVDIRPQ